MDILKKSSSCSRRDFLRAGMYGLGVSSVYTVYQIANLYSSIASHIGVTEKSRFLKTYNNTFTEKYDN